MQCKVVHVTDEISAQRTPRAPLCGGVVPRISSSSFLLSSLELSDTKVYEPLMRALLGTGSQFCEVIILECRGRSMST